jgi:hypothetical protein
VISSFYGFFSKLLRQVYIALSSMSQWGSYDGVFDLKAFYSTIVTMFESDPDDLWVIETLEWWNE